MIPPAHLRSEGRDIIVGWSALAAAVLAVFAWASCCVLPFALAIMGVSLAGTEAIAGQRVALTLATLLMLGAGWWLVWRRRQACASGTACARPSRLMVGLLSIATALVLAALCWSPFIEPRALALLRSAHG